LRGWVLVGEISGLILTWLAGGVKKILGVKVIRNFYM